MKTSDKEIIEIIADQLLVEFPGTDPGKAFEKAARLYNIMLEKALKCGITGYSVMKIGIR